MMMNTIQVSYYQLIHGQMLVGSINNSLCLLDWAERTNRTSIDKRIKKYFSAEFETSDCKFNNHVIEQINDYLHNKIKSFDISFTLAGTDFQKSIWTELLKIPYGKTITYSQLAENINCPLAVRAAANACNKNPISIIIPCHRVIGKNNQLTGYAGGLEIKEKLLEMEKQNL